MILTKLKIKLMIKWLRMNLQIWIKNKKIKMQN